MWGSLRWGTSSTILGGEEAKQGGARHGEVGVGQSGARLAQRWRRR
jgi:hypothetical protein